MHLENAEDVQTVEEHCQINDLTKLEQITLQSVLDCLINRFNSGLYYTFAGSVLVSLNPCLKDGGRSVTACSNTDNSPHVYSIGRRCNENLRRYGNNQVVVVSGDSGAGKTTVTQQLLCYFVEKNQITLIDIPTVCDGLEKQIYCATQILEAFGNASTVANPNSSRFGRLVQIQYGNTTQENDLSILGAQIETCLLEKHRVSKCAPNERNFHIFYYLLVAISQKLFDPLKTLQKFQNINPNMDLDSLLPGHFKNSLRATDFSDFHHFYNSIRTLNMVSEVTAIFEIVFGLMLILNLKFIGVGVNVDEKENNPDNSYSQKSFCANNFCLDYDHVQKILIEQIFNVDFDALEDSFVARNFCAGKRKSSIRKPCETEKECMERMSAFVTTIYDRLFNHILQRLNILLQTNARIADCTSKSNSGEQFQHSKKSISLLDLYGFENLEYNHLEQLCINYANERLQQVHIAHLRNCFLEAFEETEIVELKSLEIFSRVEQQLISRVESIHRQIFSTLDETCLLNRPQTDGQVFSRMVQILSGNSFLSNGKLHDKNYPFVVQHYASTVTYNLRGMVDKNRDYIPPEFLNLLKSSQNPIVSSMFGVSALNESNSLESANKQSRIHTTKREKTILQHFKASVESLVSRLETSQNSQDIHFIRCIRPNDTLTSGKIQRKLVEQQLYSCGIIDVIRITGNGYPIRLPRNKFFRKFQPLLKRCFHSQFNPGDEAHLNFNGCDMRFGKTQIFMTESAWESFNRINNFVMQKCSKVLQRFWRNHLMQKVLRETVAQVSSEASQESNAEIIQPHSEKSIITSIEDGSFGNDSADNLSLARIETSLLNNFPSKITIRRKQKPVQRNNIYTHTPRPGLLQFDFSVQTNKSRDIVSRRYVYESPIRFYIKKTPLSHSHLLPRRFLPQGVMDALNLLD